MKIDPLNPVHSPSIRRKNRAGTGGDGTFAKALESEASGSTVSGAGPLGAVDALLALQEVPDAASGRAKARQRAETLLDQLEDLHLALLLGTLPPGQLERLAALAAQRRGRTDDPRLQAILDEIETRTAVELAKLGR